MMSFRSRSETAEEQAIKNRQPYLIQNIAKFNFKGKYLSDKFDGIRLASNVKSTLIFKDISDDKKTD